MLAQLKMSCISRDCERKILSSIFSCPESGDSQESGYFGEYGDSVS